MIQESGSNSWKSRSLYIYIYLLYLYIFNQIWSPTPKCGLKSAQRELQKSVFGDTDSVLRLWFKPLLTQWPFHSKENSEERLKSLKNDTLSVSGPVAHIYQSSWMSKVKRSEKEQWRVSDQTAQGVKGCGFNPYEAQWILKANSESEELKALRDKLQLWRGCGWFATVRPSSAVSDSNPARGQNLEHPNQSCGGRWGRGPCSGEIVAGGYEMENQEWLKLYWKMEVVTRYVRRILQPCKLCTYLSFKCQGHSVGTSWF